MSRDDFDYYTTTLSGAAAFEARRTGGQLSHDELIALRYGIELGLPAQPARPAPEWPQKSQEGTKKDGPENG